MAAKPNIPVQHGTTPIARVMAGGQVHLSWDAPVSTPGSGYATSYKIYRKLPGGSFGFVIDGIYSGGETGAPQYYYIDTSALLNTAYIYGIVAVDEVFDEESEILTSDLVSTDITTANSLYFYVTKTDQLGNPVHEQGLAEFKYGGITWAVANAKKVGTSVNADYYAEDSINLNYPYIVQKFESDYDKVVSVFGAPRDVDNNEKVTVFLCKISLQDSEGYFDNNSERSILEFKTSNFREIIFVDDQSSVDSIMAVLAHELQHVIHLRQDNDELLFVNEGCSVLATAIADHLCSDGSRLLDLVIFHNAVSPPSLSRRISLLPLSPGYVDYGSSVLWMMYLYSRFYGSTRFKEYVANNANGMDIFPINGFEYRDVFKDWTIANYLRNHTDFAGDIRYNYQNFNCSKVDTTEMKPKLYDPPPLVIKRKADLPDKTSEGDKTKTELHATSALYCKWEFDPVGPWIYGRDLYVKIYGQDDILGFNEVVYILEDGNGGLKDDIKETDASYFSGASNITIENFGKKWKKAVLILVNPELNSIIDTDLNPDTDDTVKLISYYIEHPKVLSITINQGPRTNDVTQSSVGKGPFDMIIQFDQEMNSEVIPNVSFDPVGNGAGAEPIIISSGVWSKKGYDNDTWTCLSTVPVNAPNGPAVITISGAKNFNGDELDGNPDLELDQPDTRFSFKIDTGNPGLGPVFIKNK